MKENWQLKPTLRYVAYGLIALFLFIYNWHTVGGASDGAIYVEIPEEALRLRILAHSDHPRDQRLKEEVRDEVVELISRWVEEAQTLDEARQILGDKLSHLAQVVEEKVRQEGMVDEGGQRCGARIVVVTHRAKDAALSETVAALADLEVVSSINSVLRMEGTAE